MKMSEDLNPKKYLNKDLLNEPIGKHVWLQGTIEEVLGNKKQAFKISDSTGKAKIILCGKVDGNINKLSLQTGIYCCVLGVATQTKDLPVVYARKLINLSSQPHMKSAWEIEVKEADLVLKGELVPEI